MGLPGVKVGPLDPDATADFGQVAGKMSARQLIRLHAQSHPPHLMGALGKALDEERTKGLDMDEVRDYLDGLTLENGDPVVPEGAEVVGAAVRGARDQEQILTYVYSVKDSGRTAKWYAEYNADVLPVSYDDGSSRVRVAEMKERGMVVSDPDSRAPAGASDSSENRRLKRELANARAELERLAGEPDPDDDDDDEGDGAEPAGLTSAQDEPIEGYDAMHAPDVVKLIKAEDTSDETRQAILDYEKVHANRKGVVGAAEQTLGARGNAD